MLHVKLDIKPRFSSAPTQRQGHRHRSVPFHFSSIATAVAGDATGSASSSSGRRHRASRRRCWRICGSVGSTSSMPDGRPISSTGVCEPLPPLGCWRIWRPSDFSQDSCLIPSFKRRLPRSPLTATTVGRSHSSEHTQRTVPRARSCAPRAGTARPNRRSGGRATLWVGSARPTSCA